MPRNKRWYFEVHDGTILPFRDGKEVTNKRDQRVGPVKEVFYGAEHPQAKTFKAQALEVNIYVATKCIATGILRILAGKKFSKFTIFVANE